MKKTFFLLATISLMVACGNNSKKEETPQTEVKTEAPVLNQDSSSKTDEINVTINGTDQMTFDVKEIRVKPGQRVNVTLHHSGSLPKTAMGHNFVLLKKGVDLPTFAEKAMEAADNQYIPKGSKDIIAYTNLIGGGETTSVSFYAPTEAGTYEYICSFPGHYAMMKGSLIVE